jgi:uncharacterized protein
VAHCDICNWRLECTRQLRQDDHLSFVANCSRAQRTELATHSITTLAALGRDGLPTPFKPKRGSAPAYERLQHQAAAAAHRRETGQLKHECLPVDAGFGLGALPEPRPAICFWISKATRSAGPARDLPLARVSASICLVWGESSRMKWVGPADHRVGPADPGVGPLTHR